MTLMFLVMLTATHFENGHFVMTSLGEYGCFDSCTSYERRANIELVALAYGQDLIERDFLSKFRRYLFYLNFLASSNFVLFATSFYDRVHG